MDLSSIIIGLCAIAFFVVPIVYVQSAQKKKRKAFLKSFLSLAEQQQLNITQHEVWNQYYAIGLDASTNKLLYLKKRNGEEQKVLIDLAEVEECSVVNSKRTMQDNIIIDRLALAFRFRNPKRAAQTIEFYDKEVSMALNEELRLSEKWKNIINAGLSTPRKTALAS